MSNFSIPEDVRALSQQRAPAFYQRASVPVPIRIEAGQIWSTHARLDLPTGQHFVTQEPLLVVILDASEKLSTDRTQVSAAPLSLELEMATANDLIVTRDRSPLGFDFLIEAWNETPVLRVHLRHVLGRLDADTAAALHTLYLAQLLDTGIPESLESWVGLRVLSAADPRLDFQRAEVAAAKYLADAATAALEAPSVAPVAALATNVASTRTLEIWPILAKLSRSVKKPAVAAAASAAGEADTYIVRQAGPNESFTLELLFRPRPPYPIYLKVHELSPDLVGRQASVVVTATTGTWQGPPTPLQVGAQIPVAEDAGFQIHQVQTVTIELM